MSLKTKLAAIAASAATVGSMGIMGATSASAATPSCGSSCINLFTQKFGRSYYMDDYKQSKTVGNEQILFQGSNADPAEDYVATFEGNTLFNGIQLPDTVDKLAHDDPSLVPAGLKINYGNDPVVEFQYEPYGVPTNDCLSTWPGETPLAGYKIRLEPCGTDANSLWVLDLADTTTDHHSQVFHEDLPLINGATAQFSNPMVLNYPAGNPTDMPRPVLNVQPLNHYSNGTVYDNQEWGATFGPLS
jgi:hypothetical protein